MTTEPYKEFQHLLKNKEYQSALIIAKNESLKCNDKNDFWLTQIAITYFNSSEFQKSLKYSELALKFAKKNIYPLLIRAESLYFLKLYDSALEAYKESIILDQNSSRAKIGILNCLAAKKDWEMLITENNRFDLDIHKKYGYKIKALLGLKKIEEGISVCHEWLKISPDDKSALWHLTKFEIQKFGLDATREKMGKIAKIPSKPLIYSEIYATLCKQSGLTEVAIAQFNKISSKLTSNSVIRQKAFILAKSNKEAEALPLMEELLRIDPDDMYVHSAYMAAAKRMNYVETAWNFYNNLISKFPDNKKLYGKLKAMQKLLPSCKPQLKPPN